ncbi:hypothetical protein A4X09_0g5042 [Tilletia walkeri]|uniref:Protein DGCR14 n=1 Tax=Tilletia walkeri TaxID=117179 RepID=A0A8X7N7W2_9BASI|nr:hypothetical protein A4X09_0g5042 [Tilletia walkeri]
MHKATPSSSSSRALVRGPGAGGGNALSLVSPSDAGGVSLRGQTVLAEEDYIHSVSSIIQRDFFPDLERLKAENEYLDALQSGEEAWIEATVRALVRAERRANEVVAANQTPLASASSSTTSARARNSIGTPLSRVGRVPAPSRSPAPSAASTPRRPGLAQRGWDDDQTPLHSHADTSATPQSRYPPSRYAPSEAGTSTLDDQPQPPADTTLSLTAFQRAYTSEDNASFSRLLQLNAMKRRERYAWAYKAENSANQKRIEAEEKGQIEAQQGQRLAIAAALESDPNFQKKLKGKERQLLIEAAPSNPEGEEADQKHDLDKEDPNFDPEAALKPKEDTRPASFPSWRFTARNAFHFGPDANINTYDRSTSSLPSVSASSSRSDPSKAKNARKVKADKPGIRLNALRMPDLDGTDSAPRREGGLAREPDSPSSSRIDAAIAGQLRGSSSSVGDSTLDDPLDPSLDAFASPRVNGYGFVTPLAHTPREESVLGDYLDSIGADASFRRRLGLEVFDEEGERRVEELKRWGRENVPVQPRIQEDEEVYDGSFRVPPAPRRDQIGRNLAQRSAIAQTPKDRDGNSTPYGQARYTGGLRKNKISAPGSATPRSSAANLSPAGRLLLERTSGKAGGRGSRLGDTLLGKRGPTRGTPSAFGGTGTDDDRKRRRQEIGVREKDGEGMHDRLRRMRWTPTPSPAPE